MRKDRRGDETDHGAVKNIELVSLLAIDQTLRGLGNHSRAKFDRFSSIIFVADLGKHMLRICHSTSTSQSGTDIQCCSKPTDGWQHIVGLSRILSVASGTDEWFNMGLIVATETSRLAMAPTCSGRSKRWMLTGSLFDVHWILPGSTNALIPSTVLEHNWIF